MAEQLNESERDLD